MHEAIQLPHRVIELCQPGKMTYGNERLEIFELLSQRFSMVPLRGDFPAEGEPSNKYKAPTEGGWNKWCEEKRPFRQEEFARERAGIACGPASGILVLDVDSLEEFHKWRYINDIRESLPGTLMIKTGGKGERYHFYFLYPDDGLTYGNRSVKGIFDVRGVGGQVLCPGSLHPETRASYSICSANPILPPPSWLLEFILTRKTPADIATLETPTEQEQELSMPQQQNLLDINTLPVSTDIKQAIQTSYPKGQRSEASMKVLVGLLSANVPEQTVQVIYNNFPIGEKARENQPEWFAREIQKAKEYIAQVKTQVSAPANPFTNSTVQAPSITYRAMSALDVVNEQVDFSFLIQDFWPKGEPLLITGYGGAGKSLMTLQIVMNLICPQQGTFLDSFAINGHHRALFVQSENSILGIKRRMQIMLKDFPIPDDVLASDMVFLGMGNDIRTTGDLMLPSFQEVIKAQVDRYKADILVLDPLISFHNLNENSNDEMRRLLDSVSMFCESCGVTPLLIHHHAKVFSEGGSGGGRGASAIGDWSANTWELSGNTSKGFKLTHKKARNFSLQSELLLELVNLRFKKATGATKQPTTQFVLEALQNLGGVANTKTDLQNEIIKVVQNRVGNVIVQGTAGNYIKRAVKEGAIKEQPGQNPNSKKYTT